MKKLGRNSLALGLGTLLVTTALSFSAQGADERYESYAEGQFLVGADRALGGMLVDPLVGALIESGPAQACEPEVEDCEATGEQDGAMLADGLNMLLGPIGDALGRAEAGEEIGAMGSYAQANNGESMGRSGLVTSDGAVTIGQGGTPEGSVAKFSLLKGGALGTLGEYLADVELELGAVAAVAKLNAKDEEAPTWENEGLDYGVAGGSINLNMPILQPIVGGLRAAIGDTLGDIDGIGLSQICDVLGDLPGIGLILDPVCGVVGFIADVHITIPTINDVLGDVTNLTAGGLAVNLEEGTVKIDLAAAVEALQDNNDINNLPPNTDLLGHVVPSLVSGLDGLVTELVDGPVDRIISDTSIAITAVGFSLPSLDLEYLRILLDPILGGLKTVIQTAVQPLSQGLKFVIEEGLSNIVKLTVNVPNTYADLVETQRGFPGNPQPAAMTYVTGEDDRKVFSETALRVQLGPNGMLADLLLGNALVGANGYGPDQTDADVVADADLDADVDADEDADANAESIADADANADAIADADAVADADTLDTLPKTGAPNLLPLWLLALALILFGTAVLLNEKRRAATVRL